MNLFYRLLQDCTLIISVSMPYGSLKLLSKALVSFLKKLIVFNDREKKKFFFFFMIGEKRFFF